VNPRILHAVQRKGRHAMTEAVFEMFCDAPPQAVDHLTDELTKLAARVCGTPNAMFSCQARGAVGWVSRPVLGDVDVSGLSARSEYAVRPWKVDNSCGRAGSMQSAEEPKVCDAAADVAAFSGHWEL
jgi:hypothetical protein